jgi:NAD(P)H-hydrate epimerase
MGALRSGAGLVTLAASETVISNVAGQILEATFLPVTPDAFLSQPSDPAVLQARSSLLEKIRKTTVCAAGCGKKESPETLREMMTVLQHTKGTIVLDAGGLCSLATQDASFLEEISSCADRLIITPHPGEMAKLTGLSVSDIKKDPASVALNFATKTGAVVVLKGHRTIIAAPDGSLYKNPTGNAGLARGGSGDVLTGIIAGLAAQGLSPLDAALCGVWLHGSAADRCAQRKSMMGMLPSDILEDLGQIFLENRR